MAFTTLIFQKMRKILLALLLAIVLISIYTVAPDGFLWNKSPLPDQSTIAEQGTYRVEAVASHLFVPWSMVFTRSDRILFTERSGQLREIRGWKLTAAPVHEFKEVSNISEEGLMGLAIDPEYAGNRSIYLCLAYPSHGNLSVKVVKGKDTGSALSELSTVIDHIPAARYHAGCDLKFWPDKKLYVTTGDATQKSLAQNPHSLAGKILRLNTDGSIPEDNPFPGSPVYSLGHRNPQGIDWASDGTMYSTEHGPSIFDGPPGWDEVNLIRAWGNYGWPIVSHERSQTGLISPLQVFTPALAPASALVYKGDYFKELKGDLLFGALVWERIVRIVFDRDNPEKILRTEKLLIPPVGRIREVMEWPDGAIYFSTSNRDGRGKPQDDDDKIYRIVRG